MKTKMLPYLVDCDKVAFSLCANNNGVYKRVDIYLTDIANSSYEYMYMNVVNMSKTDVLDELDTVNHAKIIGYLKGIVLPSNNNNDEVIERVKNFFESKNIKQSQSECIQGLGMLFLVLENKNARLVSTCTFDQKLSLYPNRICFYLEHVEVKNDSPDGPNLSMIQSTFCSYLMAYTIRFLDIAFNPTITYVFNDEDSPFFKCYLFAAIYLGYVVAVMTAEQGNKFSLDKIMERIENKTIEEVAAIFRNLNEIGDKYDNKNLSICWYKEWG